MKAEKTAKRSASLAAPYVEKRQNPRDQIQPGCITVPRPGAPARAKPAREEEPRSDTRLTVRGGRVIVSEG